MESLPSKVQLEGSAGTGMMLLSEAVTTLTAERSKEAEHLQEEDTADLPSPLRSEPNPESNSLGQRIGIVGLDLKRKREDVCHVDRVEEMGQYGDEVDEDEGEEVVSRGETRSSYSYVPRGNSEFRNKFKVDEVRCICRCA